MNGQALSGQLDKRGGRQSASDRLNVGCDQRKKVGIGDIARGDEKKLLRFAVEDVRSDEIGIFGDDHEVFRIGKLRDCVIRGEIALFEIQGVACQVTKLDQADGEKSGELRIDQELHAAGSGSKRLTWLRRAA